MYTTLCTISCNKYDHNRTPQLERHRRMHHLSIVANLSRNPIELGKSVAILGVLLALHHCLAPLAALFPSYFPFMVFLVRMFGSALGFL